MNLTEKIEKAFASRLMPSQILDPNSFRQFDSDVEDALWFTGRDWHDITWMDWEDHFWGMTYLWGEVFAYYLPSVLVLSLQCPEEPLMAADELISHLDRSASVESVSPILQAQFLGLSSEEYDVIKEWLLYMSNFSTYHLFGTSGPGDNLGRAFDTLDLLQRETARLSSSPRLSP